MKINSHYKLREVAGETIVVNQGTTGMDMTRIISLNASAKLLYESLAERNLQPKMLPISSPPPMALPTNKP